MKNLLALAVLLIHTALLVSGQNSTKVNSINDGMPHRISMNVTVGKQTQQSSFGERVKTGISNGACAILFPNNQAFSINTASQTLTEIKPDATKVQQGLQAAGSALAQGAALLGGALPGGAIISAAVSSVNSTSPVWQSKEPCNEFSLPVNLANGAYILSLEVRTSTKETKKTVVQFGISVSNGAYKVVSAGI
jgi:hypothetical protein